VYVAKYKMAGEEWRQGAVALPFVCASHVRDGLDWLVTLNGILRGFVGRGQLRCSYRFNLGPSGIQRSIFLSGPQSAERELRKALAAFLRLNLRVDDSARLPEKRAEHDALVAHFPLRQCMLAFPSLYAGECWLACDFTVRNLFNRLAVEAQALGYSISYHVNCEPFFAAPALLRSAKRNLLCLGQKPGVPRTLIDLQQRLIGRLTDARFLTEEILGAETAEAAEWLKSILATQFDSCSRSTRLPTPEFQFEASACETSLSVMRHRIAFETVSAEEMISACAETEEVQGIFAWSPPAQFVSRWQPPRPSLGAETLTAGALRSWPAPYAGSDNYIFISYKNQDVDRIAPILRELASQGKRIWYDKGIPGGAEWDAVIEERIEHCQLLVLFVSSQAIQSRYVRREAKFADALQKPILSIRLESVVLSDGMAMLLNQYQMIDSAAADFSQILGQAMNYARL
jgi:hypothetical protein